VARCYGCLRVSVSVSAVSFEGPVGRRDGPMSLSSVIHSSKVCFKE